MHWIYFRTLDGPRWAQRFVQARWLELVAGETAVIESDALHYMGADGIEYSVRPVRDVRVETVQS